MSNLEYENAMEDDLRTLRDACQKVINLVDERQVGLFSWYEALLTQMTRIHEIYHRSGMEDIEIERRAKNAR